ncbi:PREDICTED: serine/threonine-protein kinase-like protein CCR1 [Tarenaya hassleriana]|uniref:serine/threonine-protein kinase-like protein CCR1 n=1 Tax=Tarenaya hassleriana TaxID=28532 RepID=UPI00053C6182|nr:PREDICTED: serine/threonine-protein kinase-like protein CCR1 [Tarenaya hassleriana]
METHHFLLILSLVPSFLAVPGSAFGSSGPIAAAFGGGGVRDGFFCAIDASGRQEVICWGQNYSSPSSSPSSASARSMIPSMAALSGGDGFLCGVLSNTSQAFCFSSLVSPSGTDLVPVAYRTNAYSQIAAGKSHVCAVRGAYYSDHDSGIVDCWEISRTSNNSLVAKDGYPFHDQSVSNLVFNKVVSGDGFSCGGIREGGTICWGPNASKLGFNATSENFEILAAGKTSLCGILNSSREVQCWDEDESFADFPVGVRFVSLTAGARHFCGIREDNHEVECWGRSSNFSSVPKGSGFKAIASSDFTSCGIREDDLVLDCWLVDGSSTLDYDPPLELCSPGLCRAGPCNEGEFAFNASILNEPDLTSLCVRKDLVVCSPCASDCSEGFFLSSPCNENSDRVCTPCSLCQNSSCSAVCKLLHSSIEKHWHHMQRLMVLIAGSCASALLLITIGCCIVPRMISSPKEDRAGNQFKSCIGKPELDAEVPAQISPSPSVTPCPGAAQVFRLSELKDATNGFKEFNELGRGSYGFVYKAVLADGRQVAVKRANAATIIHTNTREFEMELEILCSIRHCNIVNLLGYSTEMGERLLVYEYMPHGTLHDHLHGGLSPLNWSLRFKIAMQAAKGLEYLHEEVNPPIVHRDVKSSNILLDSDWVARVADFGLVTSNEEKNLDTKTDIYRFGVVLLEILTGRKSYDRDYDPPEIVEWAVPVIREGKSAAIIDRYVAVPRNVEPLLKLADMAELSLREDPNQRPTMSELANWLEHIVRDEFLL